MEMSKNHIAFTSARDINEICIPLKKHLDIPVLGYVKSFDDGSVINLHTNPDIIKNFYTKKLYQLSTFQNSIDNYHTGFVISTMLDTHPTILKTRKSFQVGQVLTFVNKMEDAVEFFHFAAALSNQKIQHSILNNLDLFERFTLYFKEKAASFIKRGEQSKVYIPSSEIPNNFSNQISPYLKNDHIRQQFLNDCAVSPNQYLLSKRESECLHHLMKGKTAKQIAEKLSLSSRTIEHYLDNLKIKFNVLSKYELIMKVKRECH